MASNQQWMNKSSNKISNNRYGYKSIFIKNNKHK